MKKQISDMIQEKRFCSKDDYTWINVFQNGELFDIKHGFQDSEEEVFIGELVFNEMLATVTKIRFAILKSISLLFVLSSPLSTNSLSASDLFLPSLMAYPIISDSCASSVLNAINFIGSFFMYSPFYH